MRRRLLDRAIERGYRLGLPGGAAAEQVLAGAIWRKDTAAVARASAKYSPPMQLIGKLYRNDAGWTADWVFVDNGNVLSSWTSSDADARRAMAAGADAPPMRWSSATPSAWIRGCPGSTAR
ncbi:hypothetical protein XPR_2029 [Xanthomonas arboricola pv. pruni MAFF 301420]|uniref:Uncharacterized protein n=1 Tax=Xanthomonas arboricola pv. pruni MAFF 301420 TaxID=1418095 RepID=W4SHF5_9XANT|nr:hypothetical protein XPR_2029 [Xanthomonas arboricola pv. pruni MAFF 301420]